MGAPKDVGAAHEALVAALKEVNLECRPDKCYVWSPSGEYGELPQVLTVSEEAGMIILRTRYCSRPSSLKILSKAASEVPAGSVEEGLLHLHTSQGGLGVKPVPREETKKS